MKKASIVSIGNELLSGCTVNNNAAYLCYNLLSCGLPVSSVHTVTDNISEIIKAFRRASEDADLIICTGGLGPTGDDLTRQSLAEFAGVELVLDEKSLLEINSYFAALNREMPQRNKVQAYIPSGAKAIKNPIGTAPGIRMTAADKPFFALPGVPLEMKQMFEQCVLPELKKFAQSQTVVTSKLNCFGIGESKVAELLGSMMNRQRNPLINTTVNLGVITIHIIAVNNSQSEARQMVSIDEEKISGILGENIFGKDEETLAQVAGKKLRECKKTVAAAESCTGGLLSKLLTDIPGSSDYFKCSWVVYSNEAKINELNVSPDIIEQFGAVSEPVAEALAIGARNISGTDFGIGITGIAGPEGGSMQKPVGLVFIGLSTNNNCVIERMMFRGERDTIRHRAAYTALNMLRLKVKI